LGKEKDYKYWRLFLDKPNLQDIEPLVLVDMPGFESPKDEHNEAITHYLGNGCHYVVLFSIHDGTITRSELEQLKLLKEFGCSFSFFLSRTNQKESAKETLLKSFSILLKEELGIDTEIIPLGLNSGHLIIEALKNVNVESIFFNQYQEPLAAICNQLIDILHKRTAAFNLSDSSEMLIEAMKNTAKDLREKSEELSSDVKERYSIELIAGLIEADVSKALNASVDELVPIALKGEVEQTSLALANVINQSLMTSLKKKTETLEKRIALDFSGALSNLDNAMKKCSVDTIYTQNLIEIIDLQQADKLEEILGKIKTMGRSIPGDKATLHTALSLILAVANPIAGIVAYVFPKVFVPILANLEERKRVEEMKKQFYFKIFPAIKADIGGKIGKYIDEMIKQLIQQINEQFELRIRGQREAIEKTLDDKKADAAAAEKKKLELESLLKEVEQIKEEIAGISR
jgi:hypothetical protein